MNFTVFIISLIAGLSTVAGLYTVKTFNNWAKRNTIALISLAAGIIFGTAFLELIPEAMELAHSWSYWAIAGFLIFFVLEQFVVMHACSDTSDPCSHAPSRTAVLGIGLHSLVDGLLIGLGFEVSTTVGIIATVAVMVHEFPEGIFSYTLLTHGGVDTHKAVKYSWVIAMATPIGTFITLLLVKSWSPSVVGSLLALTAGNFIYIAATDLIPETHKKSAKSSVLLIIVGVLLVYVLSQVL